MANKRTPLTEKEEFRLIDYYERIQNFSQNEINRSSENYKVLIRYLTLIFIVTVGAASYFLGKSKSEIETQVQRETSLALSEAKLKLRDSVMSYIVSADTFVQRSIKDKFSNPVITKLVEEEAKKRINQVAGEIIRKEVDTYYQSTILKQLKLYSNLNYYYIQSLSGRNIRAFKYLVYYRDSTKNETLKDMSDFFIQDIIDKFYHREDSLAITKRFGDKIFMPGNKIFDNLSAVVLKSDTIAENLVNYFGIVRSYNSRHGAKYRPDEFLKILQVLGDLKFP